MYPNIKIEEFLQIIDLFKKDNEKENFAHINMGRLFIDSDDKESELMLRFIPYTKKIVIARIQFKNQRVGNGKLLLDYLKEYGKQNGYKSIVLESVLTKEAGNFALKYGFSKVNNDVSDFVGVHEYCGDYILEI